LKFTITLAPFAYSTTSRARSRDRSMGFSQSAATPASTAALRLAAWVSVEEAMNTASTPSIASATEGAAFAPYRPAIAAARSAAAS
jgi:hypothetical protein